MRTDVLILDGMIINTEDIAVLGVFNVEILRQSSTGKYGSKEILFEWHIDNEDRKIQAKLAVVILLSDTTSSINIMTKVNYDYKGQGTAIDFPLCLYHKLVRSEERTIKLCSS